MRWILVAGAVLTGGIAMAEEALYPRARLVEGSYHATPAPVVAFLETLKKLELDGAFAPGAGAEPRDDLGGLSPKAWVLDHVAADFECRRDFGGVCMSDDPRVRFAMAFLTDEGWGLLQGSPDVATPEGLAAMTFGFGRLLDVPGAANGEGEHCVPAIARVSPDLDAVMAAALGPDGPGMLEAYDNFVAVKGRYRVRARPSLSAEVVNRLDNEAVMLPGPGQIFYTSDGERGFQWLYVVPGNGPPGFAALEPGDVLALSAVSGAQICVAEREGRVMITGHVGAGD